MTTETKSTEQIAWEAAQVAKKAAVSAAYDAREARDAANAAHNARLAGGVRHLSGGLYVGRPACTLCGQWATMSASLGPSCERHFDDLSG